MPTYAYACTACEHRFEAQQAFTDDALTQCPECSGRLRKLFNSVGIVFKGSGFYRTDSRDKQPAGSSGNGTAEGPGKTADSSSDGAGSGSNGSGSGSNGSGGSSSGSGEGGGKESSSGSSSSGDGGGKAAAPAGPKGTSSTSAA